MLNKLQIHICNTYHWNNLWLRKREELPSQRQTLIRANTIISYYCARMKSSTSRILQGTRFVIPCWHHECMLCLSMENYIVCQTAERCIQWGFQRDITYKCLELLPFQCMITFVPNTGDLGAKQSSHLTKTTSWDRHIRKMNHQNFKISKEMSMQLNK